MHLNHISFLYVLSYSKQIKTQLGTLLNIGISHVCKEMQQWTQIHPSIDRHGATHALTSPQGGRASPSLCAVCPPLRPDCSQPQPLWSQRPPQRAGSPPAPGSGSPGTHSPPQNNEPAWGGRRRRHSLGIDTAHTIVT